MVKVSKVMFVGLPGSGKTAFLYSLLYLFIKEPDAELLPTGAFINFSDVLEKIKRGIPPRKTLPEEANKLGFKTRINKKIFNIRLEDWSGEKFTIFADPNITLDNIKRNKEAMDFLNKLKESKIIFIFYDPTKKNKDLLEQSRGLNKAMIFLRDLKAKRIFVKRSKLNIGVAVIISKCDLNPEIFENPENWIKNYDFLYNFLKNNFKFVRAFATSAYGESERVGTSEWVPKSGEFRTEDAKEVFLWIKAIIQRLN